MSFYSRLEPKYQTISDNGDIETQRFIEASRISILPLLDILGRTAFAMVKMDVSGNLEKLRKKYKENPAEFTTLSAIIEFEVKNDTTHAAGSATDALMWLTRGLHFCCLFIKNVLLDGKTHHKEDIKPCIVRAYQDSLKRHHGWLIQKTVQIAFKAAPYYSDLITALQGDVDKPTLLADAAQYHSLLQQHVAAIECMYSARGLDPRPLS